MFKKGFFVIILVFVLSISFIFPKDSFAAYGDYLNFSFDTSDATFFPNAMTVYNDFIFISSGSDVYKFELDGTYLGDANFETVTNGNASISGLDYYGAYFWAVDDSDNMIYKYNPDGTYTGTSFSTAASGATNIDAIAGFNGFLWILDNSDDEVYKYQTDGTYTGVSFDTAASGDGSPSGISAESSHILVLNSEPHRFSRYTEAGTYVDSYLTSTNGHTYLWDIKAYDGSIWILDFEPNEVYQYEGEVPDTDAPVVITLYPEDNEQEFSLLEDEIDIEFDENIQIGTGYATIYNASDDSVFEILDVEDEDQVEVDGSEVYLYLSESLVGDSEYYIQIDATAFDDTSGNSFAGIDDENTWNFRTYDDVNPMITSLSPEDNENKINTNSDLVITFDEAVSIDEGYITIYKSFDDSQIEAVDVESEQVGGDGTSTITINLNTGLDYSTDYYIFVGEDAFYDENDNYFGGINDESVWNFTTRSNITSTGSTRSVALPKTIPIVPLAPLNSDTPLPCTNGALFSNITGLPCSTNVEVNTPNIPQNEDSNKFIFTKSLWTQIIDPDVKELQKYLNTHGYPVALVGSGSLGNETEKFGNLTRDALIKFQLANNITPAVGFFGPVTRGVVNNGL